MNEPLMIVTKRRAIIATVLAVLGALFGPDVIIRLQPVLSALLGPIGV